MAKLKEGRVFVGAAGRVTEIKITLEVSDCPDYAATVAMWFIDAPGQSVAWRHYHLAVIHLRPIEGVKPAVITKDGATHEIILVALDPKMNPIPTDPASWSFLRPINFVGQLTMPSDEKAKEMSETLAKAVADGILWAEPPLSGMLEPWQSQLVLLEEHAAGKHVQ